MILDRKISPSAALLRDYPRASALRDGALTPCAITMNAGAHAKFDVAAFCAAIGGNICALGAQAASLFSAAHVVTDGGWGAIYVLQDSAGLVSTLIPGATQTTAMNYGTEALALAALAGVAVPAGKVVSGIITITIVGADFTCNTTALDAAAVVAANLLGSFPDRRWRVWKPGVNFAVLAAQTFGRSKAGTPGVELFAAKQASRFDQVLTNPQLEVDKRTKTASLSSIALRYAGFDYLIAGTVYHRDAEYNKAFTAAHVVTADKWGAILLLVDTAGVYSTLVGEATQTTAMAYTTAALARAALPATPAGKIAIGILVVEAKNATWTANTSDIVAASDLEDFQLVPAVPDRVLDNVTLSIDAVPEKYAATAFGVVINGLRVAKAAATAVAFTAAHQCTASKYLAILIGVSNAGVLSSRVPLIDGLSQTGTQGYDSYDLAVAALPTPLAGIQPIGFIVIQADAGGWTAQTDDMTPGSDLTNVWFQGFTTGQKVALTINPQVTERNKLWPVSGAAFAASVQTDTDAVDDVVSGRGWSGGALVAFTAMKSDAAVLAPEVTVVQRPWPVGGEATV